MDNTVPAFIPVDNAAQIFIPNFSAEETTFSRIAVTLNAPVDMAELKASLKKTMKRFPYFQVYLRNRFFGYVMERTDDIPAIEADAGRPNGYIDFRKRNFMFRVKADGPTVAVETSHILTDGFGTLSFLTTMIADYLKTGNGAAGAADLIKDPEGCISPQEWKCGFRENFTGRGPKLGIPKAAWIPKAAAVPAEKYYSTRIIMHTDEVRTLSRARHVTMNVYLSAVYASALQDTYFQDYYSGRQKKNMPLRLEIPVNLRKDYPSECMRNFSYLYSPEFRPLSKRLSFDEIVDLISGDIRHERHTGAIEKQIARNLRVEDNIFFRYLPSPFKQAAFRIAYHLLARSLYSGVITNLGEIRLPEALSSEIMAFEILPANTPYPGRNTSVHSYKNRLVINIGSTCSDLRFEDAVLKTLGKLGIKTETEYVRD